MEVEITGKHKKLLYEQSSPANNLTYFTVKFE